jgi:hypothetical protein
MAVELTSPKISKKQTKLLEQQQTQRQEEIGNFVKYKNKKGKGTKARQEKENPNARLKNQLTAGTQKSNEKEAKSSKKQAKKVKKKAAKKGSKEKGTNDAKPRTTRTTRISKVNKKVDEETEFDEESPEEEVDDDYVEEVKRRTHSPSGSCVSSSDSDDDSPCESTASLDFDECIESDKPYEILAQGRSASNTATYLVRWARLDGEAGSIENASWESDEETVEELMVDWEQNGAPVKKTAKKSH